ncbi:3-isopropylmalate dehydratase small subunit [Salinispira pacifica]
MSRIEKITGRAVPVVGDDIDTDRIIPARYLKEITFSRMGEYPFYDERFNPDGSRKDHPFNRSEHQGATILIGNSNFGCGSSREHAPQALARWGIQAIVAESYAEIFTGNCTMIGVPTVTAAADDIAELQKLSAESPAGQFELDLAQMVLSAGGRTFAISMPEGRRKALLEGIWDSTSLLVANSDRVKEVASRLPYMTART